VFFLFLLPSFCHKYYLPYGICYIRRFSARVYRSNRCFFANDLNPSLNSWESFNMNVALLAIFSKLHLATRSTIVSGHHGPLINWIANRQQQLKLNSEEFGFHRRHEPCFCPMVDTGVYVHAHNGTGTHDWIGVAYICLCSRHVVNESMIEEVDGIRGEAGCSQNLAKARKESKWKRSCCHSLTEHSSSAVWRSFVD